MIIGRNNLTIVSHDFPVRSPRTLAFGGRKFPRNLIHFFVVWHFYEKKNELIGSESHRGDLFWFWFFFRGNEFEMLARRLVAFRWIFQRCEEIVLLIWLISVEITGDHSQKWLRSVAGGRQRPPHIFFFVCWLSAEFVYQGLVFFPAWLLAFCCRVPPVGPDGRRSPPEFFRFVDLCLFCPWPALNEPDMQMSSLAGTVRATWLAV